MYNQSYLCSTRSESTGYSDEYGERKKLFEFRKKLYILRPRKKVPVFLLTFLKKKRVLVGITCFFNLCLG